MGIVRGLSHIGLFCYDLPKMRSFYRDVLGLKEVHALPHAVFMGFDPEREDHDLGLWAGRQGDAKLIEQISFRVGTVQEVLDFYQQFMKTGIKIHETLTHGAEVSCYFYDPEGNRLEVFADVLASGYRSPPKPLDLNRSANEVIAELIGDKDKIFDGLVNTRRSTPVG